MIQGSLRSALRIPVRVLERVCQRDDPGSFKDSFNCSIGVFQIGLLQVFYRAHVPTWYILRP